MAIGLTRGNASQLDGSVDLVTLRFRVNEGTAGTSVAWLFKEVDSVG